MSSTSNSSNGASSGNNRKPPSRASSGPNRKPPTRASSSSDDSEPIVRHSPKKMRVPSNWTKVGQGSQGEPEFDIESQVDFPPLPPSPRGPSAPVSSDDDDHGTIISASVEAAIR